jgi:hypothetical protein
MNVSISNYPKITLSNSPDTDFNDPQHQTTKDIGTNTIAGLNAPRIINEPTVPPLLTVYKRDEEGLKFTSTTWGVVPAMFSFSRSMMASCIGLELLGQRIAVFPALQFGSPCVGREK